MNSLGGNAMPDNSPLRDLLKKEIAILEELNVLGGLKTEALMTDNLDSLQKIVFQETKLSKDLKQIEDVCSPQLKILLKRQQEIPQKLNDLMLNVRQNGLQLRLKNELNQNLIQDSLSLIQFTINSFRSMFDNPTPSLYGSSGKMSPKKVQLFDIKG